jgi:hypothetical protein
MTSYPTTLLPYYYPTTPLHCIDEIIITLWSDHLELELQSPNSISIQQNLKIISAVIDFWEEQMSEINQYEIQQRRLDSNQQR